MPLPDVHHLSPYHLNAEILTPILAAFANKRGLSGRLAETSDANPGLSPPWSNFQPKNVWLKVRPHFGEGFSGSSEEGCFFGSLAFLPFGFGLSCSSSDSCFSCSSSLKRLFSASMIWMLSRY